MKTIRLAIVSLTAAFGALIASAQQAPSEAFVASVSGSVTVLKPGAAAPTAAVIGETLPEGSVVTTGADGSALIESHKGIQTGIGAQSSVAVGMHTVSSDGVRTAVIDLKKGTTVSVLDPSKRSVNNYAVRTPKGVAAARGTTYSTTVTLSSGGVATVTVNTLTGAVSFSVDNGTTISVTAGNSANSNSSSSTTIAQALAGASPEAQAEIAEALKVTVTVVAIVAQAASTTGDTNAAATLASVTAEVNTTIEQVAATNPALAASMRADLVVATNPPNVEVVTNPDTGGKSIIVPSNDATPAESIIDITITSPSAP